MLATLDPTFAAADVKQLKQQVAGLRAQIARDDAQLNNHPFVAPQETDPDAAQIARPCKRSITISRSLNIRRNSRSFDAKISQTQATIQKYQTDASRYQQREQIAKQIEDMRATLAAHGTGSQLNLLTSQDASVWKCCARSNSITTA